MQQHIMTANVRPLPPPDGESEPQPVCLVGVSLTFNDVFNLLVLIVVAQLVLAAMLGAFASLIWLAFLR